MSPDDPGVRREEYKVPWIVQGALRIAFRNGFAWGVAFCAALLLIWRAWQLATLP